VLVLAVPRAETRGLRLDGDDDAPRVRSKNAPGLGAQDPREGLGRERGFFSNVSCSRITRARNNGA